MEELVADSEDLHRELKRIASDIAIVKQLLVKVCNYMVEAESEVKEKMRRFMMYMHDLHDISYMYTEMGHEPPPWIKREMERCDDRLRQLLVEEHAEGGTFDKVRREMADDPLNRWEHRRLLPKGDNV